MLISQNPDFFISQNPDFFISQNPDFAISQNPVSRGTSLFTQKKFQVNGTIEHQDAYHVWYRLNKELFPSLSRPLFICFLYIPPDTSSWSRSGDSYNFEKLISDVMKYEDRGEIIIMGDFNSRIANENDCIESNDENSMMIVYPFEMTSSLKLVTSKEIPWI